ncbi:MAG: type I methionyl aminopeptidase [Bacteroidetes bacterium]|nr:MAG: type I methionyl aminopeptidase [Bacteroidota bacterium]PIE88544.1 MAG: type I methionyl aminopeptidase [Bacteroidota bacterium]
MIRAKSDAEIELLRKCSLLVGKTLAEVAKHLRPGVKTITLDALAETFIRDHGALPGFKGYHGFPGSLCISVNDTVVHGIPDNYELKEGDIVSIDCGTIIQGYYGDSAYTFGIGEIDAEKKLLLERTKASLYLGVEKAVAGNRTGDIGYAVQSYVEQFGYGVVRELVGHGIGTNMHERPEVPNYGRRGSGTKLREGMTICVEPMVNMGTRSITQLDDGWTIKTADGKPSAHYELEIAVGKEKADVLTSYREIEEVIKTHNIYG